MSISPRLGLRPVVVAGLLLIAPLATSRAQTPTETEQTARFVTILQNPDGGFTGSEGGKSSLGTTSSAVRVLKTVGGSIPDVLKCIDYLISCHDKASGGFATTPGGTADVRTTATGLMAVAEMKLATDPMIEGAITYFSANVKTFEDIRIAVAGLEAVGKKSPDFAKWTEQIKRDSNPDGCHGKGGGVARATGGAVAALLRMGVALDNREPIVTALKSGQKPDGGWGKETDLPSDLETTYRVMRCFFMLKEVPNMDTLRTYLLSHRQSNGGYGPTPGATADLGSTYFVTTVLRWVALMDHQQPLVETIGFSPLFNGKDLKGWEGENSLWSVREGMLVGKSLGIKQNQFLATEASYRNFVLKLSFRLIGGSGNSGVQFRSKRVPGTEMSGYQADIGENYWGCLYDESRRNKVMAPANPKALETVQKEGWNHYVIRAVDDQITLTLNGVTSVSYREENSEIERDGKIAVQIHSGGPLEIQFKDMYIQNLPDPRETSSLAPGFHAAVLNTPTGVKRYAFSLPPHFDSQTTYPAVLFLHGSGERGTDGKLPTYAGLGTAIAGHPEKYPFVGIFPQAEKTWSADSDDAKYALLALEDMKKKVKIDPSRIVLTGLSMGGRGAWEIGAANPGKFSAVVAVCGMGRLETTDSLKDYPVWAFCGDADRDTTVINTRQMVQGLRKSGNPAKLTEYRGVGHNSWDRAYSDLPMINWMLTQKRK